MEEVDTELEVLNDLMVIPSTTSGFTGDRLLSPSEYKKITVSRATIQSLQDIRSGESSLDRIIKAARKSSCLAPDENNNGKKKSPSVEDDIVQGRLFLEQKGSNNLSV